MGSTDRHRFRWFAACSCRSWPPWASGDHCPLSSGSSFLRGRRTPIPPLRAAIGLAGLLGQPLHIGLGILPTHAYHWMIVGLLEPGGTPIGRRTLFPCAAGIDPTIAAHVVSRRLDEHRELTTGYGVLADRERLGDRDPMLRLFAIDPLPRSTLFPGPSALGLGRAHHELARLNDDQLRQPGFMDLLGELRRYLIGSDPQAQRHRFGRPMQPRSFIWDFRAFDGWTSLSKPPSSHRSTH